MRQTQHTAPKKKLDYPEETSGSRLAAKTRKPAGKLTPEEEAEHFRRGMAMIYGSQSKEISSLKESARAGQAARALCHISLADRSPGR